MKNHVIFTLTLFFLSIVLNSVYRAFPSDEIIHPFFLNKSIPISIAWYAKHLSELFSFSMLMWCFCRILTPIEKHLEDSIWIGKNGLYVFVKMWHRVLWVVAITSVFDIVHYVISFRQFQLFFLIQNTIFFVVSIHFIFKAYYRR